MRQYDIVDRLAGLEPIDLTTHTNRFGWHLTPEGPWLTWPAWRRLLDLLRARLWGHITAVLECLIYLCKDRISPLRTPEHRDILRMLYGVALSRQDIHLAFRVDTWP